MVKIIHQTASNLTPKLTTQKSRLILKLKAIVPTQVCIPSQKDYFLDENPSAIPESSSAIILI